MSIVRASRVGLVLFSLVSLIGCGGCGSGDPDVDPEDTTGKPFAGLAIDAAVPAGMGLASDWKVAVNEWCVPNEAECRLREYALDAQSGEFPQADLKEGPEVFLIPWSAVPGLVSENILTDIPTDLQEDLASTNFFAGLRNRAATIDGKPTLVPVSCPVLVCYYRKDLLDKAGLSPPETWDEYQTLIETLEDWAPGLPAVEPWSEVFRASMFLARSAAIAKHPEQFSFCFDLSTGQPLIGHPGFVTSLKKSKAALSMMPGAVHSYSPGDCRREMFAGRAALAIGYESDRSQDFPRAENIEVGIQQLPGTKTIYNTAINEWVSWEQDRPHRVTFAGFTGWVMGVSTKLEPAMNAAAWELTRYLVIEQLPGSFPAKILSPCRESQTEDPSRWVGTQLTSVEGQQYLSVVAGALDSEQLVMELPLIGRGQFREALTAGITSALQQAGGEQETLNAVAQEWRMIAENIGQERVTKSYRRSHD